MIYQKLIIIMTTAYRRRTGRALPCVNSDNTDYREHRMKSVYIRASIAGKDNKEKPRSMLQLGYFCFQCQQFWTDDDQVDRIAEELQEKKHIQQQHLSSLAAAKKWT
jgi:hypothetical protein